MPKTSFFTDRVPDLPRRPDTAVRTLVAMISAPPLLERDQDRYHSGSGRLGLERLADDRAVAPPRVGRLHGVPGRRRGGEQVAGRNGGGGGVHPAGHPPGQGNGQPRLVRGVPAEDDAGPGRPGVPRDDPGHPLVVALRRRPQPGVVADHDDRARLERLRVVDVEVLGHIGVLQHDVTRAAAQVDRGCFGVGLVPAFREEPDVAVGVPGSAQEEVGPLAGELDRLLPLVIADVNRTALPGHAERELDVAPGVELDDDLPRVVEDREGLGLDRDAFGARAVVYCDRAGVSFAAREYRACVAAEYDRRDPVGLRLNLYASCELICHIALTPWAGRTADAPDLRPLAWRSFGGPMENGWRS